MGYIDIRIHTREEVDEDFLDDNGNPFVEHYPDSVEMLGHSEGIHTTGIGEHMAQTDSWQVGGNNTIVAAIDDDL